MDEFIGVIKLFAGSYAPRGWAFCHGQLLSIAEHTSLYSILGTTYGGNGTVNFALPDLRGRVPVGTGAGPGLSDVQLGETRGTETTQLLVSNLPMHNHQVKVSNKFSGGDHPSGRYLGASAVDKGFYSESGDTEMAHDVIGLTGNNIPFNNMQPYLGMNFIICMVGSYPPRE